MFKSLEPNNNSEPTQITVADLIEKLKKCPPTAKVYHEDSNGGMSLTSSEVLIDELNNEVMLTRI